MDRITDCFSTIPAEVIVDIFLRCDSFRDVATSVSMNRRASWGLEGPTLIYPMDNRPERISSIQQGADGDALS